jgi:hypothetical protein
MSTKGAGKREAMQPALETQPAPTPEWEPHPGTEPRRVFPIRRPEQARATAGWGGASGAGGGSRTHEKGPGFLEKSISLCAFCPLLRVGREPGGPAFRHRRLKKGVPHPEVRSRIGVVRDP